MVARYVARSLIFRFGFLRNLDEWRRKQPDLPPRAEAIRRLIEIGTRFTHMRDEIDRPLRMMEEGHLRVGHRDVGGAFVDDTPAEIEQLRRQVAELNRLLRLVAEGMAVPPDAGEPG